MSIFDIPKERLSDLNDADLRELVGRLAEATCVAGGEDATKARWGGAQTAPDGGLDVAVRCNGSKLTSGGPLERPGIGIQVKRGKMGPAQIKKEMRPTGTLRPVIAELARKGGSYLIVSGAEDCADEGLRSRQTAMRAAVADCPDERKLHTDFIDRSQLATWLRGHPAVALWARERLGLPSLLGWRPHGRWSSTPAGASDELICTEGLSVRLPGEREPIRSIPEALDAIRSLVRDGGRAVRVAGLSGVGKSRLAQALFEGGVGGEPLPYSQAIYADLGAKLHPDATQMLEWLITRRKPVILVLDNCPPDAHRHMAERLSTTGGPVKLITVEYDVREDRSETTDLVRVEVEGPEIADRLVRRRYAHLTGLDTHRVAELAGGNARLALALAGASAEADTLSDFNDDQLFDRLFRQRHAEDKTLKRAAQVLSLLYSFDIEDGSDGSASELALLGSLIGRSQLDMRDALEEIEDRDLAQARGRWRAVLPQALANRLAPDALRLIPRGEFDGFFERAGAGRMLNSFLRRLAQLHGVPEAVTVLRRWLRPGGQLHDLRDEGVLERLWPVAHLASGEVLAAVEDALFQGDDTVELPSSHARVSVARILRAVAHGPDQFDRATELLIQLSLTEARVGSDAAVRNELEGLFSLFLSGTMTRTAQRAAVLRRCLFDPDPVIAGFGADMLGEALKNGYWSGSAYSSDDVRPDAYGWIPEADEARSWYETFISMATKGGLSSDDTVSSRCRQVLADRFRELWSAPALRDALEAAARRLHEQTPWVPGWHAARQTLHYEYGRGAARMDGDAAEEFATDCLRLQVLAEAIEPRDLVSQVQALLRSDEHDDWALADVSDEAGEYERAEELMRRRARGLGRRCAFDQGARSRLGVELFQRGRPGPAVALGEGLGEAIADSAALWSELLDRYRGMDEDRGSPAVLAGFLDAVRERDPGLTDRIMEECADDAVMRRAFGDLVTRAPLTEEQFDRVIRVLGDPAVPAWQFSWMVSSERCDLTDNQRVRLLVAMLRSTDGPQAVMQALGALRYREARMGHREQRNWPDALRAVGVAAVKRSIEETDPRPNSDHRSAKTLDLCLRDGDTEAASPLVDAVARHGLARHGFIHGLEEIAAVLAAKAPRVFLDRVLLDPAFDEDTRSIFFRENHQGRNVLGGIAPAELVAWCRAGGGDERWSLAAKAIHPFGGTGSDGALCLSEQACVLLDEAPEPGAVVDALATHLVPTFGGSYRSAGIEARMSAMEVLRDDSRPAVREAIERHFPSAGELMRRHRDIERQMVRDHEQRFE